MIAYAGICAWLFAKQRELIYLPHDTRIDVAPTDFVLQLEGARLRGWVVNPDQHNPVIYFGGNAERVQNRREQLAACCPGTAST